MCITVFYINFAVHFSIQVYDCNKVQIGSTELLIFFLEHCVFSSWFNRLDLPKKASSRLDACSCRDDDDDGANERVLNEDIIAKYDHASTAKQIKSVIIIEI